jgi:hypothetical protein
MYANNFPKEKKMSEPNASPRKKITLPYLFKKVTEGSPITWLTCYDFPTAY